MGKAEDPYLDAGVMGWIVNASRKHYWKVKSWYEFEDLVQDGYLCFAKCRARFRGSDNPSGDDRRTFMVYFQRAFINHIVDLAKNPRSQRQEVGYAALSEDQERACQTTLEATPSLDDVNLCALLASAPAEILEMLNQILVDGVTEVPYFKTRLRIKELPGGVTPRIVRGRRPLRETTAEHFDRCLGKPGVVKMLREFLVQYA